MIGLIEVWWRVDWKSNHTIRVNANPTIKRWIPYDLIVHTSKLSLNWRRYFNIKFLFVLTKLCLYSINLIQGRSLGQWGWLSGWAFGLKVVVLSLIRSSLVQVQVLALWKNSLGQRFTPLWAHLLWTVISHWLKVLRKHCGKTKKKKKKKPNTHYQLSV